ncbi:MAG: hypothetical protein V7646_5427 [Pseudonocardia sp.]
MALGRALDRFFDFGRSVVAMTRRFSMLDVPYERSRLLHGQNDGLGQRVPDVLTDDGGVLTDDGGRLHAKMPAGAVLRPDRRRSHWPSPNASAFQRSTVTSPP